MIMVPPLFFGSPWPVNESARHIWNGAVFSRRTGLPRYRCEIGTAALPPKGFLLFLNEKKQKSRLGTDVGLARRNLNCGSTRTRFSL